MNLSAKTEYACLAALDLAARHGAGEPVRVREIASAHDIPERFLVQILLQLKAAGLVQSTRGSSGGYQLARDPDRITLLDVVTAVEGCSQRIESATGRSPGRDALFAVWNDATTALHDELSRRTLAELVALSAERQEKMYYI